MVLPEPLPKLKEGGDMARGINKVIIIGNLGQDPDVKAMPSGMTVANLRIATSESSGVTTISAPCSAARRA